MWTSSQVQKDIRITHLNHWPKNLINKYIHYKSNVLSTFSWLEPVLTPALDIEMAKSGSNLVHIHPSHILCLTPCVKARKSFHGVLPCPVMMYHQTNLDCKSFSISALSLTLNIPKWYFWMILWLMMMHHHTMFDWSGQRFTEVQNLHCDLEVKQSNLFTRQSSLSTVKLSWPPKNQQFRTHNRNHHETVVFMSSAWIIPWMIDFSVND